MMMSVLDPADAAETETIVAFLHAHGAAHHPHAGGRSLLEHLVGTSETVRRWGQPAWIQRAALVHSVYGTAAHPQQLIARSSRAEVAAVVGERAERLAYLFCITPPEPLLAGTHRWAKTLPTPGAAEDSSPPTRGELDALVLLHMANLADQAAMPDGSPARWLVKLAEMAELLDDSEELAPPAVAVQLSHLSEQDEAMAGRAYRDAVARADDPVTRRDRFALSASTGAVLPEPCVWLAYLSATEDDMPLARAWSAQARNRLHALGTAWDKRLRFDQWEALLDALADQIADLERSRDIAHPRALFDVVSRTGSAGRQRRQGDRPRADAGRGRFHRYVDGLSGTGDARAGAVYPDLPSTPWHDPADFPIVAELEANYRSIQDEILGLDASRFHRESERISRSGEWDVAFFYERGRRNDAVCAACPVTADTIERHATLRTAAGLIYASRMRGATHIDAHRGPTNLRVRCHLGIQVPDGDCAIRVGEETRQWVEGRCLVFDDYFEHEAWNHTDEDRIVLIVDLWHPGLSATEIALLEGLQNYTHAYAQRLARYWATNAAARTSD
jgi:aspartate beta-hydroxylase